MSSSLLMVGGKLHVLKALPNRRMVDVEAELDQLTAEEEERKIAEQQRLNVASYQRSNAAILAKLPRELYAEIFGHVTPVDLISLEQTCILFRDLIRTYRASILKAMLQNHFHHLVCWFPRTWFDLSHRVLNWCFSNQRIQPKHFIKPEWLVNYKPTRTLISIEKYFRSLHRIDVATRNIARIVVEMSAPVEETNDHGSGILWTEQKVLNDLYNLHATYGQIGPVQMMGPLVRGQPNHPYLSSPDQWCETPHELLTRLNELTGLREKFNGLNLEKYIGFHHPMNIWKILQAKQFKDRRPLSQGEKNLLERSMGISRDVVRLVDTDDHSNKMFDTYQDAMVFVECMGGNQKRLNVFGDWDFYQIDFEPGMGRGMKIAKAYELIEMSNRLIQPHRVRQKLKAMTPEEEENIVKTIVETDEFVGSYYNNTA